MGRKPVGKGSSFVPREMLQPMGAFGETIGELAPAEGLSATDRRVRGAQLQHLVMVQLRSSLKGAGNTRKAFAASQGMSLDRLYRIMRGEALMQIADLASFALINPRVRVAALEFLKQLPDPEAERKAVPYQPSRDLTGPEIFESRTEVYRDHHRVKPSGE